MLYFEYTETSYHVYIMLSDSILPLYFTTTRARQQLSWAAMLAHLSSRVFEFLVETFGTSQSKRKEKIKETQEREVFRARMSHLWLGERAWIWAKRSGEITGVWNWETVRSPIPAKKKFMYSIYIYIYMFIYKYIYIYYVCVFFFFSGIWMDSVLFRTSYTGQALGCPAKKIYCTVHSYSYSCPFSLPWCFYQVIRPSNSKTSAALQAKALQP